MTTTFWCCGKAMGVDHTGYNTCSVCKRRLTPPITKLPLMQNPCLCCKKLLTLSEYFKDGEGI